MKVVTQGNSASSIAFRVLLFSSIWWILTDASLASWWIGLPAVLFAVIVSFALISPTNFIWYEFFKFVIYFFMRSLIGGVDVAWRAFHPAVPIKPALVEYPLRLPPGLPQILMINTISLLPGTLVAERGDGVLKIHALDVNGGFKTELEAIEKRVARVFAVSLNDGGGQ